MSQRLALDTNLLLLLLVGQVAIDLLPRHKRLKGYTERDFAVLSRIVSGASELATTPSALSEVSNLLDAGVVDPLRARLIAALAVMTKSMRERYAPSAELVDIPEFPRLGLTDVAWLELLRDGTVLLTADQGLYAAALKQRSSAYLFADIRRFGI